MKIEIWSDFVCPFCYIGKRRLEQALEKFPEREHIEIIFKSFELDPYVETNHSISIHEALAKKYGIRVEEAKSMNENVIRQAKSVGLEYNFENMSPTNTFRVHRLAKYAETEGKALEMTERLLSAHFIESKRIDDLEHLVQLAEDVGLDREKVLEVLQDETKYAEEVRRDEQEAGLLGIRGVPFFVINRKYAISGAQPEEVFLKALQKVAEEERPYRLKEIAGNGGLQCNEEGCDFPGK